MSRDEARAAFAASGMTYDDITMETLKGLRFCINKEMRKSGAMKGTLRCRRTQKPKFIDGQKSAIIRCQSYYFEDREVISFNPNGFVGFAGWADDQHLGIITSGFMKWISANAPVLEAAA